MAPQIERPAPLAGGAEAPQGSAKARDRRRVDNGQALIGSNPLPIDVGEELPSTTAVAPNAGTPPVDLAEIAEQIRARIRHATMDFIDIGRDLISVKAALRHGEFIDWIDAKLRMSARSAQSYMQMAKFADDNGKSETISHLPPSTLRLLSAPSTSEAIKREVISDMEAGKRIDLQSVEGRIRMDRAARGGANRHKRTRQWYRGGKTEAGKKRREAVYLASEAASAALEIRNQRAAVEAVVILRKLPASDVEQLIQLLGAYDVMGNIIGMLHSGGDAGGGST